MKIGDSRLKDTIEKAYRISLKGMRDCYESMSSFALDGDETAGWKKIILAGKRNFKESWIRDTCFAAFGASIVGDYGPVKTTLGLYLDDYIREDGMLPLRAEYTNPIIRAVKGALGMEQSSKGKLKPRYTTEHFTAPVDQTLVTIAVANYVNESGDTEFARKRYDALEKSLWWSIRQDKDSDMLIEQDPAGDWADSLLRRGKVLYSNVCFYKSVRDFAELSSMLGKNEKAEEYLGLSERIKKRINEFFWSEAKGYYKGSGRYENFVTDGNVLAMAWGLADKEKFASIQKKMKEFGMADPVPLKTVHQKYPFYEVSPIVYLGGIADYHNGNSWLWLGAFDVVAKTVHGMYEEAEKELEQMAHVIVRDGDVNEVFDRHGRPMASWLYRCEAPHAWNSGTFVYAYNILKKALCDRDKDKDKGM